MAGTGCHGRQYVEAEVAVEQTIDCLAAGVVLTRSENVPVALMLSANDRGMSRMVVIEVVAAAADVPHRLLARVRGLMDVHNVMRGKVMTFSFDRQAASGGAGAHRDGLTGRALSARSSSRHVENPELAPSQ